MTTFTPKAGTVYIVGAGPGAPDLIAVRGRDIIAQADLVLYADSLVEHSVAEIAGKPDAEILPSSGLHLEQMVGKMVEAARAGKVVARVHSGDPALYGATHEQMALLEDAGVPYEIVPGITAAFAAAALLGVELTIPDLVQTIILTRTAGRTTMPEKEDLQRLASAGASLAIYLSVTRMKHVIADLLASGGYTPATPCAVLHKTTWPDESHVIGTLADIAGKVREAGYTKHALILVSPVLDPELKGKDRRTSSHLYDKTYTHRFRKAVDFERGKEKREKGRGERGKIFESRTQSTVVMGEKHLGSAVERAGMAAIGITRNGSELAARLAGAMDGEAFVPDKFVEANAGATAYEGSVLDAVREQWADKATLLLVMPTGVASRAIAPLLQHKSSDPAVLCMDEGGNFVIPLLGGHQAGANGLAEQLAQAVGGVAVITTASDVQDKPALDLLGQADGWKVADGSAMTHTSATLVNEGLIALFVEDGLDVNDTLAALQACGNVRQVATLDEVDHDSFEAGVIVSHRPISDHHVHLLRKSTLYRPAVLTVGIGCKRGVAEAVLREALEVTLADAELAMESVGAISSADLKADEAGLIGLAESLGVRLKIVGSDVLRGMDSAEFSPSAAQDKFGIAGVAEPTAVVVSGGRLIVEKRSFESCTVAVAIG